MKQAIILEVLKEVREAKTKFPLWPSDPLHAKAILDEESGELTRAMLQYIYEPNSKKSDLHDIREEAVQTAAMALRFLEGLSQYKYEACKWVLADQP